MRRSRSTRRGKWGPHRRFARGVSDGRYVFEDLPFRGPIEFRVGLGGRQYSQLHDSPANEATIVVPEHGSLEIRCDFALETNYLPRLRLTAANRSEIVEIEFPEFSNRPGSIFFPSVLTGRYSASVISSRDDDRGADRVLARIDEVFEVHAHRATKLVGRRP